MFVDQLYIYRRLNLIGALLAGLCISFSQFYVKEALTTPSPIFSLTCTLNIALLACFVLAFLHHPYPIGQKVYALFSLSVCLSGLMTIGLHLWNDVQNQLNGQDCQASMIERMGDSSFLGSISSLYSSTTQCAEPSWNFIGLSMTDIALVNLSLLLVVSWKLLRQPTKARSLFK
ncbi:MAG: disulfide bond formation protein B [Pontibacterium sp.]